jgi:hypothetical protein
MPQEPSRPNQVLCHSRGAARTMRRCAFLSTIR